MQLSNQAMTSSDIIATCSVIVAVLAFAATALQTWLSHRHNKLSVRPLLVWHISRRNETTSCGVTYSVRNLGLGPAIISDRHFTKDNVRFSAPKVAANEVNAFVEFSLGERIKYHLKSFGMPGKDSAIPSQGEVIIAELYFPTIAPRNFEIVEKLAGNINFHVKYKSIYGECFEFNAEPLIPN